MKRKTPEFDPEHYPVLPGATWQVNRYELPYSVRNAGGELMSIDVLMVLELPSEKLLTAEAIDPSQPHEVLKALTEAVRKPSVGKGRRPERIVVPSERMAKEVSAVLRQTVKIEIGPVAELDAAFAMLAASTAPEPPPSYLDGDATPVEIGRLFDAMAHFYEVAPWNAMTDSQGIRVDIPALDVSGACMLIMGAAGASTGFLYFDSIESYESFHYASEAADRGEPYALDVDFFSVSFEPRSNVAPSLLSEIRKYKWTVAGPDAYPSILSLSNGVTKRPVTSRDVRVSSAAIDAFLSLFESGPPVLQDEDPRQVLVAKYLSNYEGDVTITIPWVSDEEIEAAKDEPVQ